MRVIVKPEICEGNAVCMAVAPEVFVVGDDDQARVLVERPDEALRAKVALAVRRCPRQALELEDAAEPAANVDGGHTPSGRGEDAK